MSLFTLSIEKNQIGVKSAFAVDLEQLVAGPKKHAKLLGEINSKAPCIHMWGSGQSLLVDRP
jgi:hypothetical protein